MSQQTATIRFSATLYAIDSATILQLPEQASRSLPSRGQVAVSATIGDSRIDTVVEPDGRRGHWLKIDPDLQRSAGIAAGDQVDVAVDISTDWPEPDVPADFATALESAPQQIRDTWHDITPMARWEWVRWVGATANPATRARRVEVGIDKMKNGKRRPCCFDLSACTDPELARSGKLRQAP